MIIIGHRGAKGLAKENSLEAIKKGIEYGSDMLEVDLRMSGNSVVLSHDATIKTEDYCSLTELLDEVNGKLPIILEVKEIEVVSKLKKLLEGYEGELIFSSKSYSILDKINKTLKEPRLAVTEKWSGVRAVAEASLLGTKDIHINHNWLWSGFVRSMKHKGYNLYAYTVNNLERAKELEDWGVDGIFTDRPDKFKGE